MNSEKKLWLCEQYAHKAWTLSLVLAQEAARAGGHGKGFAVIAHEARQLADKLFDFTAKVRFDSGGSDFTGIADLSVMLKLLATNAMIEIMRVAEFHMEFNIPKSMAVFAEEMRRLASDINELAEKSVWDKPFAIPEMAAPSASGAVGRFFKYSICGYPLIENMSNICEVNFPAKADIEGNTFFLRGNKIPLINCYRRFDLPYPSSVLYPDRQMVVIVCLDGNVHGKRYAVPIDDVDIAAIFHSRNGTAVPALQGHAFAEYAHECWDAVSGEQFVFVDWKKLIEK
jgi:hypothetical protein